MINQPIDWTGVRELRERSKNDRRKDGSLVFGETEMNRFQKWADAYGRAFGFIVTLKGNWVELTKDGATVECMSVEGVQAVCYPGDPSPYAALLQ